MLGLHGLRVTTPAEVDPRRGPGLSADRPTLIETMADPYQALGREDTDLGRRALAHLRRDRATGGFDDPQ